MSELYCPIVPHPNSPTGTLCINPPPLPPAEPPQETATVPAQSAPTPPAQQVSTAAAPPTTQQAPVAQPSTPPSLATFVQDSDLVDSGFNVLGTFVEEDYPSMARATPYSPLPLSPQPQHHQQHYPQWPAAGSTNFSPAPAQSQVVLAPQKERKSKAVRAVDLERQLREKVIIKMVREALYLHNGQIYHMFTAEQMHRMIRLYCREAVEAVGNASIIEQVFELLKTEPYIAFDNLEEEKSFIAFENGLLDLRTNQLIPHTSEVFVTAKVCATLTPEAVGKCPIFYQFLNQVSGGDPLLQQRIWEMLGYCLSPDTDGKCFFLLQGVPDSGKSLLGDFLSSCFEESAVTSLDINAMGTQFGPSELIGKRLCVSMDLAAAPWDCKAMGVMKMLTGNDLLSADVKYQHRVKFRNISKLVFGTNHAVSATHQDDAFFRRMVTIPFQFSVPKAHQDRGLASKFQLERDAIIATAITAYLSLRHQNYQFSGNFEANAVLAANVPVGVASPDQAVADFFYRYCQLEGSSIAFAEDLYAQFQHSYPMTLDYKSFSAKLSNFLSVACPESIRKDRKRKPGEANAKSAFVDEHVEILWKV